MAMRSARVKTPTTKDMLFYQLQQISNHLSVAKISISEVEKAYSQVLFLLDKQEAENKKLMDELKAKKKVKK